MAPGVWRCGGLLHLSLPIERWNFPRALPISGAMQLKITTWNINSVRLRIDLVAKFIKAVRPDVLCLQETKCPDDSFPRKRFKRLGYEHIAINGQKGYHGVAVLSRLPFDATSAKSYCGKGDSRHVGAVLGERAGLRDPLTLHNYYVPAGGDEPDPAVNPKFAHKLSFLDEMRDCPNMRPEPGARAIVVGDLNVAPLECDVWNHKALLKVVSHTPIECEKLIAAQQTGGWIDAARTFVREPQKLYTWWSYRAPDWAAANKGRRLDHIWVSQALGDRLAAITVAREARGWLRPSDHVPVTATLEV
jgi:exodeoxyribonuclease-3